MKTKYLNRFAAIATLTIMLSACGKDDNVIPDIPPSDGTTMTLNGGAGGSDAENSVYVDFSAETQLSVKRLSWDLAFYSGNEFRVKLNNMAGAATIGTDETDLNAVTAANFDINTLAIGQGQGTMDMIDAVDGSISGTAIAEVSGNDNDNKVYVISTKGGTVVSAEAVYKVRILRKGEGYTVQYGQLDATTYQSIDVAKNTETNFQYVSFTTNNVVAVEPKKEDWDIVWGYSMYFTGPLPYSFSDLVFINHLSGVTAAEVLTESVSYADFGEGNLSAVTFNNNIDVIGSNWRATSPPATAGVKNDRFYVIKDGVGNIYKLKFNSFTGPVSNPLGSGPGDGGERGKPEIEFKLVKRG